MIISLLTDFGLDDNFVGAIKGVILSVDHKADIVDITHNIKPHDIFSAAFLLEGSYKYFPRNTLHMVVVDPGVGSHRKIILVKTKKYIFLAPDNGILTLSLKNEKIENIIEVSNKAYFLKNISSTFHARDILASVAGHISKGVPLNKFGVPTNIMHELPVSLVNKLDNKITGKVIYIDRFGNLVTDITKEQINGFKVSLKIKDKVIEGLSECYSAVGAKQPLILVNSFGYLEIALNCSNAKDFFGVSLNDVVEVFL